MPDRLHQFKRACDQFVERTHERAEVIGIVVCGSFIYGNVDEHSDLDIYVILDTDCNYRERGNTWINGVEIEYFMNPPQQIRAYFRQEKSPHTADMLANGKLVYRDSKLVDQLIMEARDLLRERPAELSEAQIELGKYGLDDLWKDLEDCRLNGNVPAGILLKNQLLNTCIDLFCGLHRIRRTKHKRIVAQLTSVDPDFAHELTQAAVAEWPDVGAIGRLKKLVEKLLGGARSREWQLRSALDL